MISPTQRTLKKLKDEGISTVQVVERWNAFAKIRQDLFGIIDILAIAKKGTVGIQVTTKKNMSTRIRKMEDSPHIGPLRDANWTILVHGWFKNKKGKWEVKEIDIS